VAYQYIKQKGDEIMAKNRKDQLKKNNTALPKADLEFAEERGDGFEQVALQALKKQNK
jgi:hypothetical protein